MSEDVQKPDPSPGQPADLSDGLASVFARAERGALAVGLVGLVGALIALISDYQTFIHGYMVGFMYWFALPVGAICLLMIHHLVGGRWGGIIRRPLEAAALTFPLMALFFVPIALSLPELFPWARPDVVALHSELQHKSAYLNIPFFLVRALVFFLAWTLIAWLLRRLSVRESHAGEGAGRLAEIRRFQTVSALGLVVVGLTGSFAVVDWTQSLEPLWFSSEYPMMVMVGQLLSAAAFFIVVAIALGRFAPLKPYLSADIRNDLANILLVFVVLWAYTEFMQFLIIWSGDTHERIPWYVARARGGWAVLIVLLAVFQFFVPLFSLLFKKFKRKTTRLLGLASLILLLRVVDYYWLIAPAFYEDGFVFLWPIFAALAAIGGAWVWVFCRLMRRAPIIAPRSKALFITRAGETPGGSS